MPQIKYFLYLLVLIPNLLFAAKTEFIDVDTIYAKPGNIESIHPYSINLSSSGSQISATGIKNFNELNNDLLYLNKVKVNNKIYYRLVYGNFKTQSAANDQLSSLKLIYPSAWINFRTGMELSALSSRLLNTKPVTPAPVIKIPKPAVAAVTPVLPRATGNINEKLAEKLMQDARQKFLDQNYPRVLAITGKIAEIGTIEQQEEALELTGIVRERQQKIPQAVAIYTEFLALYPDSKIAPKIRSRLEGLKTMRSEPKKRLAQDNKKTDKPEWYVSGSASQYYRNDVLAIDTLSSETVNDALVSDINLFARKKTDKDSLVIRFDGGLVNDFLDSSNDTRIGRAMVNYTNNEGEYQIIGGRQSRTIKGIQGRFDGVVYKFLSNPDIVYSLTAGFPVQSSYDSFFKTDRVFYGGSINIKPAKNLAMDFYLVQQDNSGLTDRQAIGTELQYRSERGFIYGIIDYDLFYEDLNNVTAITNYRHNDKLSFNFTLDQRNSPLLTTGNAIQGQGVSSLDELLSQTDLTDEQIYQLAEDRTSKSSNLIMGSTYKIDDDRQIYLSLSLSSIEATKASDATATTPAVAATSATDDIYLSGDYTVRRFFIDNDFTTFGARISDTSSSQTTSFRIRSRINSSSIKNLRYDPRLRIDYRSSKITEDDQYIINPSFKVTYKPGKKISLEGSLGLEYSDYDLPDRNNQQYYNLFLGYVYSF